jgi:hypothetical protein
MGPLIPLAGIAAGVYAIKRWFDKKTAAVNPAGFAPPADGGAPPDAGGPVPDAGGGSGGGSGGPYDPGYPMTADPTYAGPKNLVQIAAMKKEADRLKLLSTRPMTSATAPTLSSLASRLASFDVSKVTAAPAPAPAPPPLGSLSRAASTFAPAPSPTTTILKPGSVIRKI